MERQALEFRITLMTIVIVVIFVVCNSFESLLFILHSQELLYRNIVEDYLRPICDVLMVFNSSVNVFIYGTVSTQFRAAFYKMFFCLQIRVSERMSCKQLVIFFFPNLGYTSQVIQNHPIFINISTKISKKEVISFEGPGVSTISFS